jgi:uncharacterized protein (TIGR03382 family)
MLRTLPSNYRISQGKLAALLAIGTALSGGFGCQAAEMQEGVAHTEQAIVNGTLSEADEAVVALVYHGKQFCTGTLVGQRTVLTAAHCLPPHVDVPLYGIEVYFGTEIDSAAKIRVIDGLANPDWNPDIVAGDVGVLALQSDAPVAPMPMGYLDVAASGLLGNEARAVGFGITEADGEGNGTRRSGMLTIDRYDESSIYLRPGPSATCNGDSGGALIFWQDGVEVLGGIHSRSDCNQAIIAERVDVHAIDFVMPFIEEHEGAASCDSDGLCATGCADADPDCPCAADGICSDVCAHPSADLDCSSECPADGVCDESCSYDYDCTGDMAGTCEGDDCDTTDGGCSAGGSSSSTWALMMVLFLFIRRRRA